VRIVDVHGRPLRARVSNDTLQAPRRRSGTAQCSRRIIHRHSPAKQLSQNKCRVRDVEIADERQAEGCVAPGRACIHGHTRVIAGYDSQPEVRVEILGFRSDGRNDNRIDSLLPATLGEYQAERIIDVDDVMTYVVPQDE
jgi:hypothetical protein